MRSFLIAVFAIFLFVSCLTSGHGWQRTHSGEKLEDFEPVAYQNITPEFSRYIRDNKLRYTMYKVPNYVKDFLKTGKGFKKIYKKNKVTVVSFRGFKYKPRNYKALEEFYQKLDGLLIKYPNTFNSIVRKEIPDTYYPDKVDQLAYKDLRLRCNRFCLIDPRRDTIFVFSKITEKEKNSLEILFQETEKAND